MHDAGCMRMATENVAGVLGARVDGSKGAATQSVARVQGSGGAGERLVEE